MSAFGSGILVGTALIIILPEGIEVRGAPVWLDSASEARSRQALYQQSDPSTAPPSHGHDHAGESDGHGYVGLALVLGFLLMLLVEQLVPSGHVGAPRTVSVNNLHQELDFNFSPTYLGILVHAAADGVAFGGASAGGNSQLGLVVFIAIMVHKAPAAFGMTTFLRSQGYSRKAVRQQLLLFSCVAPIWALLTHFAVTHMNLQTPQHIWTGLVLLFSAGYAPSSSRLPSA